MGKRFGLFLLFLSCFFFLPTIPAQEKIVEGGKTFYLHQVKKGEGFYRLSVIYQVAQKEIIDANPDLAFQGLKEGSIVKIPVPNAAPVQGVAAQSEATTYTVKKGETLYSISRAFGVSIDKIVSLNPGVNQNLQEGVTIQLPANVRKVDSSAPSLSTSKSDDFVIHTVAPGETLFGIAQQYLLSLEQLRSANSSMNEASLAVGEKIRIPRKEQQQAVTAVENTYIIHKVATGETLYSISQKYGRLPVEIKLVNEALGDGDIHVGESLRIPRKPLDLMLNKSSLFLTHDVSRKETLYGIGRNYNIDVELIKLVNPNINLASLKKGVEIRIPRAAWYKEIRNDSQESSLAGNDRSSVVGSKAGKLDDLLDSGTAGVPINVALLMPFDYAGHQLVSQTPDSLRSDVHRAIVTRSKTYLEFYEGVLMALDSLKKTGTSINLYAYDTRRDSANFSNFLQREELSRMNLIIGPANIGHMKTVAAFAQDKHIPVVFPFGPMDGSIRSNPYVYQASPIDSLYRQAAVDAQLKFAANKKVIVLTTGGSHPFELAVINQIKQHIQMSGTQSNIVFHRYAQRDAAAIQQMLSPDDQTFVLIANIEELKVSRMVANLSLMVERSKASVTVFGFSDWFKFQSLEAEDLHRLNTTILSPYGADYAGAGFRNFAQQYRQWFKSEPVSFYPYFQQLGSSLGYSRFGMWGYDVTFYFVGAIARFGSQFDKSLDGYKPNLMQTNFRFNHFTNWGGAYNTGLMKIQFNRNFQTQVNAVD